MTPHLVTRPTYYRMFIALLVLTGLTVGIAMIDLGPLNTIVALTIAVSKALIVILVFMHLRYSSRLTWLVFGSGFFWLALLITLTMSDYLTRGWLVVAGW